MSDGTLSQMDDRSEPFRAGEPGIALPVAEARSVADEPRLRLGVAAWSIVATCGLLAMAVAFWIETRRVELHLAREAEVHISELQRSVESKLWILKASRAYFAGSVEVDSDEFSIFVEELRGFDPDIQNVSWARFDAEHDTARVVSSAPPEPQDTTIVGLDLLADTHRRERLKRAADENGIGLLGGLHLEASTAHRTTFAIPVYAGGPKRFGSADPRQPLLGFLTAELDSESLAVFPRVSVGSYFAILGMSIEDAHAPRRPDDGRWRIEREIESSGAHYRVMCTSVLHPSTPRAIPFLIGLVVAALVALALLASAWRERATERRRLELEALVRERTQDLEASNRELDAFSYSVSHDLRAPLRAVNGFADALSLDHDAELSVEARGLLARVQENGQRALHLVDDLLRLSRLGRAELHRSVFETEPLVREIIGRLMEESTQRAVDWEIGSLPTISADRRLLEIVFTNLLSNALKFTRGKQLARIHVGHDLDREGNPIFFVRDNGTGFDPRYSERLFAPFQRLHGATEFEGTGIGLALCKRSVERHNGWIRVDGAVDEGATVRFSLDPRNTGA